MNARRRWTSLSLTVLALVGLACSTPAGGAGAKPQASAPQPAQASGSNPSNPAPAGDPIKIGELGEYTGPFAGTNLRLFDTLEWLVQRDGGQIAGRPVQFIRAED